MPSVRGPAENKISALVQPGLGTSNKAVVGSGYNAVLCGTMLWTD